MRIVIKTQNALELGKKLKDLHRSAFPSAIRNTLNEVAFNAKKIVPEKTDENFTVRQKNLFKRSVIVDKAKGFNVDSMSSKIGLDSSFPISEGLAKQETGGNLKGRKLVPHDKGRISGNHAKKLQAKNQFKNIGGIGTPRNRVRGSKYIMIKKNNSKGTVFNVKGKKLVPVFVYRNNPISKIKKKPYIYPSAKEASKNISAIFRRNAEFQINKYMRT